MQNNNTHPNKTTGKDLIDDNVNKNGISEPSSTIPNPNNDNSDTNDANTPTSENAKKGSRRSQRKTSQSSKTPTATSKKSEVKEYVIS